MKFTAGILALVMGLILTGQGLAETPQEPNEFAVSGPGGSQYRLLRAESIDAKPMGAFLIKRDGGGATLMNIMFDCGASSYAYLAMNHSPILPVSDDALTALSGQSRNILTTGLQSVPMTPITDDPYDAPLKVFNSLLCLEVPIAD